MSQAKTKQKLVKNTKAQKYYKCERCGYVGIVSNSYCPICAKDGKRIKLK